MEKTTRRTLLKAGGALAATPALWSLSALPGGILPERIAAQDSATTNLGVSLPTDAAPYDQQIYRAMTTAQEPQFLERAAGVSTSGSFYPFYFTEPLIKMNTNNELIGIIAESWLADENGLTWTFKIRNGLQWSDGEPLTANDVLFTYQRIADPNVAFDWAWFFYDIKNMKKVVSGEAPMSELGVSAPDEHTFVVTLEQPAPYFPAKTLMLTISPQHVIQSTDGSAAWSTDPETAVSGGPWKLSSWERGKQIVFEANPLYTGVLKPYLNKIVIKIGSSDAVTPAYQTGEIDTIAYVEGNVKSPADVARAKGDPEEWGLHSYTDYGTYFLVFNNQMEPFTNTKVRQAISRAIDRDALVASAGRDLTTAAFSMLPPGFPAHNPDLEEVQAFDVAQAQALLSEAGYPGGEEFPDITLSTWGPLEGPRKGWLEGIQSQLKQNLGISVKLDVLEIKVFYEQKAKHVYPFSFQQYQYDYIDPSNLLDLWKSGNYDYSNPEFDALIDEADHFIGSQEDRLALYQQAERILVEDAGGVFLYWPVVTQFWRPYLQGASIEANREGIQAWRGNKLSLQPFDIYVTNERKSISS